MDREEILFRRLVRAFLEKHGDEVRKIVKGDILLEAGLKRLEEIAGISHESRCHEGAANPGEQHGTGIRPVSAVSDDPGAPTSLSPWQPRSRRSSFFSREGWGCPPSSLPHLLEGRGRPPTFPHPAPPGVKPPAPTSFSEEG
ncbi:hypothetical protein [Candidatus Pyrohabitans sp.]